MVAGLFFVGALVGCVMILASEATRLAGAGIVAGCVAGLFLWCYALVYHAVVSRTHGLPAPQPRSAGC